MTVNLILNKLIERKKRQKKKNKFIKRQKTEVLLAFYVPNKSLGACIIEKPCAFTVLDLY